MVQIRLDEEGDPTAATFAAHAGAYGCDWSDVDTDLGHLVAYIGAGSHASYPHAGSTNLTFPAVDYHRGNSSTVLEPVQLMSGTWPGWHGRWGASTGTFGSPVNVSEQGDKWDHPSDFHEDHDEAEECEAPE